MFIIERPDLTLERNRRLFDCQEAFLGNIADYSDENEGIRIYLFHEGSYISRTVFKAEEVERFLYENIDERKWKLSYDDFFSIQVHNEERKRMFTFKDLGPVLTFKVPPGFYTDKLPLISIMDIFEDANYKSEDECAALADEIAVKLFEHKTPETTTTEDPYFRRYKTQRVTTTLNPLICRKPTKTIFLFDVDIFNNDEPVEIAANFLKGFSNSQLIEDGLARPSVAVFDHQTNLAYRMFGEFNGVTNPVSNKHFDELVKAWFYPHEFNRFRGRLYYVLRDVFRKPRNEDDYTRQIILFSSNPDWFQNVRNFVLKDADIVEVIGPSDYDFVREKATSTGNYLEYFESRSRSQMAGKILFQEGSQLCRTIERIKLAKSTEPVTSTMLPSTASTSTEVTLASLSTQQISTQSIPDEDALATLSEKITTTTLKTTTTTISTTTTRTTTSSTTTSRRRKQGRSGMDMPLFFSTASTTTTSTTSTTTTTEAEKLTTTIAPRAAHHLGECEASNKFTCADGITCVSPVKVCDNRNDCPAAPGERNSFDEENCGCSGLDRPLEILIALDMSYFSYKLDRKGPKRFLAFARKIIERLRISSSKNAPGNV
ncbi:Oidioi.mRNA.OKI2018_I69.chr2.g5045.t1.cds [Oikopleura dioica]|uniref:Oidioi.mRNA.OKI2018_I69.chr2.g5045.t1.cds n=1 Tax=Oikopleura dioica TaxID=34765 RepID=A0ABN7T300_OIKDI|nr:Oidioi.mRNA.OKI2018_I69.chr2.g5045.t1.cds [Oikopleura dioica]